MRSIGGSAPAISSSIPMWGTATTRTPTSMARSSTSSLTSGCAPPRSSPPLPTASPSHMIESRSMSFSLTPAPDDFAAYWSAVMAELAALPAAPELTHNALRSNEHCDVYDLRLTSIGPYRIFAFYSIPKGDGPFPVNYHIGGYGSVVHIAPYEERRQYVTVALRHRGQRLADQPFAAAYPGLLTSGIDSPLRYIYRGIVADCCRVIDFLVDRPEVDASRISVVGDDLALITAALRPQVDSVHTTPTLFYGAEQLAPRTKPRPRSSMAQSSWPRAPMLTRWRNSTTMPAPIRIRPRRCGAR
ncbi:MAG: hypothetical protein DCC57_11145 [Chloroflexi bacterium]|nr:MAG: hypothetical protein DCC57_11145 [Chloroflexota bacterium]